MTKKFEKVDKDTVREVEDTEIKVVTRNQLKKQKELAEQDLRNAKGILKNVIKALKVMNE